MQNNTYNDGSSILFLNKTFFAGKVTYTNNKGMKAQKKTIAGGKTHVETKYIITRKEKVSICVESYSEYSKYWAISQRRGEENRDIYRHKLGKS